MTDYNFEGDEQGANTEKESLESKYEEHCFEEVWKIEQNNAEVTLPTLDIFSEPRLDAGIANADVSAPNSDLLPERTVGIIVRVDADGNLLPMSGPLNRSTRERIEHLFPGFEKQLNITKGFPADELLEGLLSGAFEAENEAPSIESAELLRKTNDPRNAQRYREIQFVANCAQLSKTLDDIEQRKLAGRNSEDLEKKLEAQLTSLWLLTIIEQLPVGKPGTPVSLTARPAVAADHVSKNILELMNKLETWRSKEVQVSQANARQIASIETRAISEAFVSALNPDASAEQRRVAVATLNSKPLTLQDQRLLEMLPDIEACAVILICLQNNPSVSSVQESLNTLLSIDPQKRNTFVNAVIKDAEEVIGGLDEQKIGELSAEKAAQILTRWKDNRYAQTKVSQLCILAYTQGISGECTQQSLEVLGKQLAVLPDSEEKEQWLNWINAQGAISELKNSENATVTLQKISERAERGDQSAREILRLILLCESPDLSSQWRTRELPGQGQPLNLNALRLDSWKAEDLTSLRAKAFVHYSALLAKTAITQEDAKALAWMTVANQDNLQHSVRFLLARIVEPSTFQLKDSKQAAQLAAHNVSMINSEFMNAIHSFDRAKHVTQIKLYENLLTAWASPCVHVDPMSATLSSLLDGLDVQAKNGDATAIRLLTFIASDPSGRKALPHHCVRASKILKELGSSEELQDLVLRNLTDSTLTSFIPDKGYRLSVLADVVCAKLADKGLDSLPQNMIDRVRRELDGRFNKDNPAVVSAFVQLHAFWTHEHIEKLALNLPDSLADVLDQFSRRISPQQGADLMYEIAKNVQPRYDASLSPQDCMKLVKVLSSAPNLVDERTVMLMSRFAGARGRQLLEKNFSVLLEDKSTPSKEIQKSIGNLLLLVAEQPSPSRAAQLAIRTYANYNWDDTPMRFSLHAAAKLQQLVKARSDDWFIQSEIPKLLHANNPRETDAKEDNSTARQRSKLTAYWIKAGVSETGAPLLLDKAIKNYGLEKVNNITENISYLRGLEAKPLATCLNLSEEDGAKLAQILNDAMSHKDKPGHNGDLCVLLGLLANGSAHETPAKVLMQPLKDKVEAFQNSLKAKVALLAGEQKRESAIIERIANNAVKGVGFDAKVKDAVSTGSGSAGFRTTERQLFDELRSAEKARTPKLEQIAEIIDLIQQLEIKKLDHQFFVLMFKENKVAEADLLAKTAYAKYGANLLKFAPEIRLELIAKGEGINHGTFARMKESGNGVLAELPAVIEAGTAKGYEQGKRALIDMDAGMIKRSELDARIFRDQALSGIQTHPVLQLLSSRWQSMSKDVENFFTLIQAGTIGDKCDDVFVNHLDYLKKEILEKMRCSAEELNALEKIEQDLEEMLSGTNTTKYVREDEARKQLNMQLSTVRNLRSLFDVSYRYPEAQVRYRVELEKRLEELNKPGAPNLDGCPKNDALAAHSWKENEKRKTIEALKHAPPAVTPAQQLIRAFNQLRDPDFRRSDNLRKWWDLEGAPALAGFVTMTAVMLACSNPVTGIIAGSVLALCATELTKEVQLFLGVRANGSLGGDYFLRGGQLSTPNGTKPMDLCDDVLAPYACEVLTSSLTGLAAGGAGAAAGSGLARGIQLGRGLFSSMEKIALTNMVKSAEAACESVSKSPLTKAILNRALFASEQAFFFVTANGADLAFRDQARQVLTYEDYQRENLSRDLEHKHQLFSFVKDTALTAFVHSAKVCFKGYHRVPKGITMNEMAMDVPALKLGFDKNSVEAIKLYKENARARGSTIVECQRKDSGFIEITNKGLHVWFEPKVELTFGERPPLTKESILLPHDLPQQSLPGMNPDNLGPALAWMGKAVSLMNRGEYHKAYELVRKNADTAANLQVKTEVLELPVEELTEQKVLQHINRMRTTGRANLGADGNIEITEPATLLKFSDGTVVDLRNPTVSAGPGNKPLTPKQRQEVETFMRSRNGQRIFAEHSFLMFEELFHAHQLAGGGSTLSPLYRRFCSERPAELNPNFDPSDICNRNNDSYEREFLIAAYEAGLSAKILQEHFSGMHSSRVEPMEFINKLAQTEVASTIRRLFSEKVIADILHSVPPADKSNKSPGKLNRVEDLPKSDPSPWQTRELDPKTQMPADPLLSLWFSKQLEHLELTAAQRAALEEGLRKGTVKLAVLDRNVLCKLEGEGRLFSFEGGQEVNSAPYRPGSGGPLKTPLQHADSYDPAIWPAAVLMVRVTSPRGEYYYVTNGCRRIHVFGSEPLNPSNKPLPVIVFDGPSIFNKILDYDPTGGINRATPFTFATKDWSPPPFRKGELRRTEDIANDRRKYNELSKALLNDELPQHQIDALEAEAKPIKKKLDGELANILKQLEKSQPELDKNGQMLVPSSGPSGPRTEAAAFNEMLAMLQATPAYKHLRLYKVQSGSTIDGIGWDYLLVNTVSGDFRFIDVKEVNPVKYTDFHKRNTIVAFKHGGNQAQLEHIRTGFEKILVDFKKQGSPFNLLEFAFPDDTLRMNPPDHFLNLLNAFPQQSESVFKTWQIDLERRLVALQHFELQFKPAAEGLRKTGRISDMQAVLDMYDHVSAGGHKRFLLKLLELIKAKDLQGCKTLINKS